MQKTSGKYKLLSQGPNIIYPHVYSEVIVCSGDDPDKLEELRRQLTGTIWKVTGRSWRHDFLIVDDKGEIWGAE